MSDIVKKITEQIDFLVANPFFEVISDEKLFADMANFLIDLDPEVLSFDQLQKMVEIFNNMESEADKVEENINLGISTIGYKCPEGEEWDKVQRKCVKVNEEVKAKKTAISDKQYASSYYRQKKQAIKKKKNDLERSIEGKKRNRMKPIMAKGRKTPTGRHKVTYH